MGGPLWPATGEGKTGGDYDGLGETWAPGGGDRLAGGGAGTGGDSHLLECLYVEGEASLPAQFVTYASLIDMLADTNRLGIFTPGGPFARNIVGSGATIIPLPAGWALMLAAGVGLAALRARRRAA